MSEDTFRGVDITRTSVGRYEVRNSRGGSLVVGTGGDDTFTPVELLLAAIGGCTAIDVDLVVSRRDEPDEFQVRVTGDKVRDESGGNRMQNLAVEFTVRFPAGPAGDAAREMLPRAVRMSHDRLCTVSRTVELGTPVSTTVRPDGGPQPT
ncbi:OsmC family protein [Micromonospora echinofusca]|uniref:OsmC family peroxiredoxin n=1 Tax=Micromonospora echinofusca TaxID=47858 RepID=A0ABS3W147_MICEH|nr:OsmC family protein [Micromonospora echinofusca]MBO4210504.1 OsmC family peroxiredoxin [Micromonospora echinofusca]